MRCPGHLTLATPSKGVIPQHIPPCIHQEKPGRELLKQPALVQTIVGNENLAEVWLQKLPHAIHIIRRVGCLPSVFREEESRRIIWGSLPPQQNPIAHLEQPVHERARRMVAELPRKVLSMSKTEAPFFTSYLLQPRRDGLVKAGGPRCKISSFRASRASLAILRR